MNAQPILEVDRLSRSFGGLRAVNDLSFQVAQGTIHGLIGPNGAGKTTTFNLISGFYRPDQGEVRLSGQRLSGQPMHRVARQGVVRTFQHATLFAELTVMENVEMGTHMIHPPRLWQALIGRDGPARRSMRAAAAEALEFFHLEGLADTRAGDLAHGHQRALGMAVALAAQPKVMLLDEPFAGMNTEETNTMMGLMRKLREAGMTVLLVEHDMHAIMGLCDSITVMSFGKLLAEGSPEEIGRHPDVIAAYLGTGSTSSSPADAESAPALSHTRPPDNDTGVGGRVGERAGADSAQGAGSSK